jgi:arginase family enzyme
MDPATFAPQNAPRYMEIPTFMRAPPQRDPAGLDVAMIGVPYDGGVTCRAGIHRVSRINPFEVCRVADVGDVVEVCPPFDPSGNTALGGATIMYEILRLLAEVAAQGKG